MDNRSRLPRAASNPSIRPAASSTPSLSSVPISSIPSRLPAPSRLTRQASTSQLAAYRKCSVPLCFPNPTMPAPGDIKGRDTRIIQLTQRSELSPSPSPFDRTLTPSAETHSLQSPDRNAFRSLACRSPAKRLQPSRSTTTLPRSTQPQPEPQPQRQVSRPSSMVVQSSKSRIQSQTEAKPLGLKRTVSAAHIRPVSSSASTSALFPPSAIASKALTSIPASSQKASTIRPVPRSRSPTITKAKARSGFKERASSVFGSNRRQNGDVKTAIRGLIVVPPEQAKTSSDTDPSKTTKLQENILATTATPLLPRFVSRPHSQVLSRVEEATTQLKDTELSFVEEEDDSGDISLSALCLVPDTPARLRPETHSALRSGYDSGSKSGSSFEGYYQQGGTSRFFASEPINTSIPPLHMFSATSSSDANEMKLSLELERELERTRNNLRELKMEKDEEVHGLNQRIGKLEGRVGDLEVEQMAFTWRQVLRAGESMLDEIREEREMLQKMREDTD